MIKKIVISCAAAVVAIAAIVSVIVVVKKQKDNGDTKPRKTTETDIAEANNIVNHTSPVQDDDSGFALFTDASPDSDDQGTGGSDLDNCWFIDVTDEATVKKLVDDLIACEPRAGDLDDDDHNDFGNRVLYGFDQEYWTFEHYSNGNQFDFEYSLFEDNPDLIQSRDHVARVGYDGYEVEDMERGNYRILRYDQPVIHTMRPGVGDFKIYVYDEERAETCAKILRDYVSELYKDEIVCTEDLGIWGFAYKYADGPNDYVAIVRKDFVQDNHSTLLDRWEVEVTITFNTPNMMPEG